jgi:hypothetical protein
MNYTMLMIVCMTMEVCTAMFDDRKFSDYDTCYEASRSVVSYMQETYPDSAGEVWCLTPEKLEAYREYIDQGGKPELTTPEPQPSTDI